MEIQNKAIGNVFVVTPFEKRIDASVSTDFKGKMVDWVNAGKKRIVLNLGEVDFIDSSGLGAIVSSLKAIGDDGDLVICNMGDTIMRLFRLTRMNRVFQIFPTEEEALEALSREHGE